MSGQAFTQCCPNERVPERVASRALFQQAGLQGLIQRVEDRRVRDRRLERGCAGQELAERELRRVNGSSQPQNAAQGLVHTCQPHRRQATYACRDSRQFSVTAPAKSILAYLFDEFLNEQRVSTRPVIDLLCKLVADILAPEHDPYQLVAVRPGQAT